MQLNVEGFTKAKRAIINHLTEKHKATAIFLQETHFLDLCKLKIFGYNRAVSSNSSTHETAQFVKNSASWNPISLSKTDSVV